MKNDSRQLSTKSHIFARYGGLFMLVVTTYLSGCGQELSVNQGSSSGASTGVTSDSATSGPHPKVVIDEPLHQFGFMEMGTTLDHEFEIRNEGEATLKLKKDRSTCKCTMADFEEVEIAPGDSYKVRLEWIGKVEDENFSQAAYITTNDPENAEVALTVSGIVENLLIIHPKHVWSLGQVNNKEETTFSGKITSNILDSFDLNGMTLAEGDPELISIKTRPFTPEELEEQEFKSGYQIDGVIAPGLPIGSVRARVVFDLIVKDKPTKTSFDVQGYVPGSIQILGFSGWNSKFMLLDMGRFQASEGFDVKLTMFIKDNEHGPIEMTDVKTSPEIFDVSLVKDERFKGANRERYELNISVPPGSPPVQKSNDDSGFIEIKTNNPMIGSIKIRVLMICY